MSTTTTTVIKRGSQTRETLKSAGYTLIQRLGKGKVILQDSSGKREIWQANNNHAGYAISIGRWGYEFCRSVTP